MKTKQCKQCLGTGYNYSVGGSPYCTSCNGTGIEGEPRGLMIYIIVSLALFLFIIVRVAFGI